ADGNTVHVAADGATERVDGANGSGGRHGGHPADVGRLAVIDPTETADLLRTLGEAHTGQRQPAPPVEASPAARPALRASKDQPGPAVPGRAQVFLLGPPRVDNLPPPSRTDPLLRPQAVELLVYLVTHGGSANKDDILIDVLGDAPQKRALGRLSTFVYSLRR